MALINDPYIKGRKLRFEKNARLFLSTYFANLLSFSSDLEILNELYFGRISRYLVRVRTYIAAGGGKTTSVVAVNQIGRILQ